MEKLSLCTPANYRKFIKKFLEYSKGNGPYVDCLSGEVPYAPVLPTKTDFFLTTSNVLDPDDPRYDPEDTLTEKIYLYVEPIYAKRSSEDSKDSKAKMDVSPLITSFAWSSTGQKDLAKAHRAALLLDIEHCVKRDRIVGQLLASLSPESTTLISNVAGFNDAVQTNNLWALFKEYLPLSHDRVSTSAVHKRTREFLTRTQTTALPEFIADFRTDSEQFLADWESTTYPGYVKIDGLLRNTFIEGVKGGHEYELLKPALESLALSRGSHRDASLQAAMDTLSSYHIRNKKLDSLETSVAFKGSAPTVVCALCHKQPALANDVLHHLVKKLYPDKPLPKFKPFQDVCDQCVRQLPRCKCGKSCSTPWHSNCAGCFKSKSNPKVKSEAPFQKASHESKAHVASSNVSAPSPHVMLPSHYNSQSSALLSPYGVQVQPRYPHNSAAYYPPSAPTWVKTTD